MEIGSIGMRLGAGVAAQMTKPEAAREKFQNALDEAKASSAKPDHTKIADAARQFEALMIGQILKAAHGSESSGWLGAGEDDETSATAVQIAEEYLGQAIANGGGLGIAKMVVKGLDSPASKYSSSGLTTANPDSSRTDLKAQD